MAFTPAVGDLVEVKPGLLGAFGVYVIRAVVSGGYTVSTPDEPHHLVHVQTADVLRTWTSQDNTTTNDADLMHLSGAQQVTGVKIIPVLDKGGATYNIKAFGSIAFDGVTDDTAAWTNALSLLPASASLDLPAGVSVVGTTSGVTIANPTAIKGRGGLRSASAGITVISCPSRTVSPITVAADGCSFADLAVINTAGLAPTAGAGLLFSNGNKARLDNVDVLGFYNCVQFNQGTYWNMIGCMAADSVNYGLYIQNTVNPDNGDMTVMGNLFGGFAANRIPVAGVCWESGGGLRFTGNKINGGVSVFGTHSSIGTGLLAQVADGVTTSVMVIEGNSIEGWNSAGIDIKQKGTTGSMSRIQIANNELAGSGGTAIAVHPGTLVFGEVTITANSLGGSSTGILVGNVDTLYIGPNTHKVSIATAVQFLSGVTNYFMQPQIVSGDSVQLFTSASEATGTQGVDQAQGRYDFQRAIPVTTSSLTYSTLWRVGVPIWAGGKMVLTLAGNCAGVGAFVYTSTILYTRAGSGNVAVAVQGADGTGGAQIDISWDVTAAAGEVQVKLKLHTAVGSALDGRASLLIDGNLNAVKKGA